jgi:hypothetical protein
MPITARPPRNALAPANTWHPGQPCKHQRKFFATPKKNAAELEAESDAILAAHKTGAKRLAWPVDNAPLIKRGGFRPVDTLPSEEKAAKPHHHLFVWWTRRPTRHLAK